MPTPINPRGEDNPSTYFVEDRSNDAEMVRLMIQDNMITEGLGGPLSEQLDVTAFQRILDIGCGPGGWILEIATLSPHTSLVGIDISWRMIEYARACAQAQKLTNRTEFRVMDALRPLEFPDNSFDLVSTRMSSSFMLIKDWPRLLQEMQRVTRPGGIVRVTDVEMWQSNSPAHMRLSEMLQCAAYKAGLCIAPDTWGFTPILSQLLTESGCRNVQTEPHTLQFIAGTEAAYNFYQNLMFFFQTLRPFIHKWGCATEDYDATYEQAMIELQQKDFRGQWNFLIGWGSKPE